MSFLGSFKSKDNYSIFLDPEFNRNGSIRENIIAIKKSENYELKALFRTYYLNDEIVIVVSRFDSFSISGEIEYFVQKFCYQYRIKAEKVKFYEVIDPIFNKDVTLRRFTSQTDLNDGYIRYLPNPNWKESLTIEEFEKIIGTKYQTTYYTSLQTPDHLKYLNEGRLKLITYSMSALRSVDGLYDIEIKNHLMLGEAPFQENKKFYSKLQKINIKCENNELKKTSEANFELNLNKYPEHFYKISNKFARYFDGFEFEGFKNGSEFVIARTHLTRMISEMHIKYIKNDPRKYLIDDNEMNNLLAVVDYVLCTNLSPINLKLLPTTI
ncbi:hypothetical protein [Fluviispira sanaruensis]|uniref:Uncharacterized protein n=1 Tax=Fluviispira sanaruensis TaxID=2493639 RepID=A0A4P2VNY5_FLUSA|nr:hypothetical protein [Fluviispira sanaruensis]BBH54668.1 hypothetical protein JCM31447_31420 [Fluviispira sanaruensis]